VTATIAPDIATSFEDLNLSPTMMAAVSAAGYSQPTPIQAGLIPRALADVDVLGQARTGTGKTAAFVIPILEKLDQTKKHHGPQALILVPTRELAVQVREEVVKLSHGRKVHSVAIYGGKPIKGQIDKLRRGAEVIIGTPGRVLDHLARGTLVLRDLRIVVLDEADRMLDIGFRPDIEKILKSCPQSRQTLLLSATVPPPVERLSKRYMRDPETQNFSPKDVSVETIEQFYYTVEAIRKFELLEKLILREEPRQAIIFCRTKRGTEKIYQRLSKKIENVATIHGDLHQGARDRVMAGFRAGEVRYLVATDVVGRGIDVSNISHIINYDIPQFCDDYVHRVGRTGRMGREGVAYTFVTPEEGNELTRIEMRINRLLKREEMPGISSSEKPAESVAHVNTGPVQWKPGVGWGGDSPPASEGTSEPAIDEAGNGATESPPPAAPAKPTKRYRRAL
jgi:ATP-dependent RNA helicase DeaD